VIGAGHGIDRGGRQARGAVEKDVVVTRAHGRGVERPSKKEADVGVWSGEPSALRPQLGLREILAGRDYITGPLVQEDAAHALGDVADGRWVVAQDAVDGAVFFERLPGGVEVQAKPCQRTLEVEVHEKHAVSLAGQA